MCLPMVTRELALGTVGATVATTRAAGGGPEGELHGGEHHRGDGLARTAMRGVREVAQAVDDGLIARADFGAGQDGAQAH